jgi:hypothetical protein
MSVVATATILGALLASVGWISLLASFYGWSGAAWITGGSPLIGATGAL